MREIKFFVKSLLYIDHCVLPSLDQAHESDLQKWLQSDKTVECIKKDKQENLEWVESHLKKRCCLFRLLDPEIDSKNHGFLNFQDTPLIPYDNL